MFFVRHDYLFQGIRVAGVRVFVFVVSSVCVVHIKPFFLPDIIISSTTSVSSNSHPREMQILWSKTARQEKTKKIIANNQGS